MGRSYGGARGLPMAAGLWGSQPCRMDVAAKPGQAALRRGRISLPGQVYHVTTTTQGREPIFNLPEAAFAAAACFHAPGLTGDARLLCWVLMPDHAHWLLQLGERDGLACVVCRLKSASARAANAALGRSGAVWSRAFHDHALRCDEDLLTLARYIVVNPVRAGLVPRVGDYPFWNAVWL
jgi:putative transposase